MVRPDAMAKAKQRPRQARLKETKDTQARIRNVSFAALRPVWTEVASSKQFGISGTVIPQG
ncbi:MAG: hypothetical protein A2885_20170 [Sphingopyxis sp. RIFCSPHIGHO2_01_FULL_65_24]|nr:MAG: hypothetical protein A2885_20170 [Sphingopyxis sp. RIFCSPHIGHO2_01_FULL_65_24]